MKEQVHGKHKESVKELAKKGQNIVESDVLHRNKNAVTPLEGIHYESLGKEESAKVWGQRIKGSHEAWDDSNLNNYLPSRIGDLISVLASSLRSWKMKAHSYRFQSHCWCPHRTNTPGGRTLIVIMI
jgi:hypothetical protein